MNYYILPKKSTPINLGITKMNITPMVSFTLNTYLSNSNKEIEFIKNAKTEGLEENENIDFIFKLLNPFQYLYSNIPNTGYSVSKHNDYSSLYYNLIDIIVSLGIFNTFSDQNIKSFHFSNNYRDTINSLFFIREREREYSQDFHSGQELLINDSEMKEKSYNFLFYELDNSMYEDLHSYITGFIFILRNILQYQHKEGVSIIKIADLYYKPLLDIVFLLTRIYDKVYIIKPITANVFSNERFIVCKQFIYNHSRLDEYNKYIDDLTLLMNIYVYGHADNSENIYHSLINSDLPYNFISKIEDSNMFIGHQQIEYIDQVISMHKNKSKEDKIENIKKSNIQKCIHWCEKHKVLFNKQFDKQNMFH
jgi:hypothetical protein